MQGGSGHADETFDYGYQCRRCGKKITTFVPMNTLTHLVEFSGRIVHMSVEDCFVGDVKILKVLDNKVLIEIVDVIPCYRTQSQPLPGKRYWIDDYLIDSCEEKLPF